MARRVGSDRVNEPGIRRKQDSLTLQRSVRAARLPSRPETPMTRRPRTRLAILAALLLVPLAVVPGATADAPAPVTISVLRAPSRG